MKQSFIVTREEGGQKRPEASGKVERPGDHIGKEPNK
jgi:hypothetical protein